MWKWQSGLLTLHVASLQLLDISDFIATALYQHGRFLINDITNDANIKILCEWIVYYILQLHQTEPLFVILQCNNTAVLELTVWPLYYMISL